MFVTPMLHSQEWAKTQLGTGIGNCGPTCAAMIVESQGIPITVEEARSVIGYSRENGATSMMELSLILDRYNIDYAYLNDIELYENGFMIVLVNMEHITSKPHNYDGGHYLVIYGIEGFYYKVIDPLSKDPQLYMIEDVNKYQYGEIIYVLDN